MTAYKSNLASLQPTKMDTDEIKRDAWRHDGILVVCVEDTRLGWVQREQVQQIGNLLFGKVNK